VVSVDAIALLLAMSQERRRVRPVIPRKDRRYNHNDEE
jgi:hypothetical protein